MKNEENKYNRVVAYIRKSSEDNEDGVSHKQLNSVEYQHRFPFSYLVELNTHPSMLPNVSTLRTHFLETEEEYEPIFIT